MDRITFISWLLSFFDVSDYIFQSEMPKYNNGLLKNLDYDGLKGFIEQTCKTRPTAVEINKYATMYKFFSKEETHYRCPVVKHISALKNEPRYSMQELPQSTKDAILALKAKIGIKTCLES